MKSFYEMVRILEENKNINERWPDSPPTDEELGIRPSFSKFLGDPPRDY